jgi:predicted HTH transcriptional regulator
MISIVNLQKQIAAGEDSTRQFKADVRNAESLASEMAAFANSEGGMLFIGVADDCSIPGLTGKDVSRINQLISNAASHLVRNPLMSGKVSGKTSGKSTEKSTEKSSEKVLKILKNTPALSAREVADRLELSPRAVEKQIAKLREKGLLRRVGPAKGGHWEVLL